ncbi:MAG: UDP-N-acetylmuramoyl-tripeptide--D-alanyl-D-alanine ligase, partial [Terriglobia bacterium]
MKTVVGLDAKELAEATGAQFGGAVDAPVSGVRIDSRQVSDGDVFIPLPGAKFDGHSFLEAAADQGAGGVFAEAGKVSPKRLESLRERGVAVFQVSNCLKALQDVARHVRRRVRVPVVAITGSTGKTSTKDMVAGVLGQEMAVVAAKRSFNNEVGLPLTLLDIRDDTEAVVVEMAMRGLGEIRHLAEIAEPDVGVVTNIGVAHVGRVGSRGALVAAKSELVEAIPAGGDVVLNRDDPSTPSLRRKSRAKVVTFGEGAAADVRAEEVALDELGRASFVIAGIGCRDRVGLPFPGRHQIANSLAAACCGRVLGVAGESIVKGLAGCRLSGLRMDLYSTDDNQVILDDCYNANPVSMEAALETLAV